MGRLKRKMGVTAYKARKRISNSFIGKTYRAIASVVKSIVGIARKIYNGVKKTIKAVWKATKSTARAFYGASKFVGGLVKSAAMGTYRGIKKVVNMAKSGKLGKAIMNFAPAQILTKMGWKAIKFVGKKVWQGIKAIAAKALNFFMGVFGLMGKFVNKVSTWAVVLGHGIKDNAYRFIVQPVAALMTTVFSFVSGMVTTPINFIKWLVPTVMDRVNQAMENIKAAVGSVLDSTRSMFGKILKSKVTWLVLIVGVFFLFRKWIFGWLQGEHKTLKEGIFAKVKTLATKVLGFLKTCWNIIFTVGKFLFNAIDWLTNPKGWIANAIRTFVGAVFAIKRWIKDMVKKSGKNGLDALCMFIAGDYIGLAIAVASAYVKKAWDFLKNTKLFRFIRMVVGALVAFGKLYFKASTVIIRSLGAGLVKIIKGDFGGVAKAIVKPWADLWA